MKLNFTCGIGKISSRYIPQGVYWPISHQEKTVITATASYPQTQVQLFIGNPPGVFAIPYWVMIVLIRGDSSGKP